MNVDFTPVASTIGGLLIGLSASLMLLLEGRVTGISGILGGLLSPQPGDVGWRGAFLVGLFVAGAGAFLVAPAAFGEPLPLGTGAVVLAGLLVGFGTRLGNGCTSGHGVCGLSRLSVRSLAAVLTFMATGGIAVFVVRHLLGGSA